MLCVYGFLYFPNNKNSDFFFEKRKFWKENFVFLLFLTKKGKKKSAF